MFCVSGFIYLFLAAQGLRCFAGFSLAAAGGGSSLVAGRMPLTAVPSQFRARRLGHAAFSSCGAGAWLLRGTWNLPRSGMEPVGPALSGKFLSTIPSRKSLHTFYIKFFQNIWCVFYTCSISLFKLTVFEKQAWLTVSVANTWATTALDGFPLLLEQNPKSLV